MECSKKISERTHIAIREAYEKVGVLPDKEGILNLAMGLPKDFRGSRALCQDGIYN